MMMRSPGQGPDKVMYQYCCQRQGRRRKWMKCWSQIDTIIKSPSPRFANLTSFEVLPPMANAAHPRAHKSPQFTVLSSQISSQVYVCVHISVHVYYICQPGKWDDVDPEGSQDNLLDKESCRSWRRDIGHPSASSCR
jgi:hypothetical protein